MKLLQVTLLKLIMKDVANLLSSLETRSQIVPKALQAPPGQHFQGSEPHVKTHTFYMTTIAAFMCEFLDIRL